MPASAADAERVDYVFGYGSLAELAQPLSVGERLFPAAPGRLRASAAAGAWR